MSRHIPNYRVAIMSCWSGGPAPEWADQAVELQRLYAQQHNYAHINLQVAPTDLETSGGQKISPTWSKVFALRTLLETNDFDLIFAIDTDSFFLDFTKSIDDLLPKGLLERAKIAVTGDQNDVVNTGHLFVPNNAAAKKFLDDWWELRNLIWPKLNTSHQDPLSGRVMDQPAFNFLLAGGKPNQASVNSLAERLFNRFNGYPGNPDRKFKFFNRWFARWGWLQVILSWMLAAPKMRGLFKFVPMRRLNWYPRSKHPCHKNRSGAIVHYPGSDKKFLLEDAKTLRADLETRAK